MIVFDDGFTLLTLSEVADRLGITRFKIEQSVRSGALAAVHHGGRWMVAEEEVERFRGAYRPPTRTRHTGVPRRFVPPARPARAGTQG